MGGGHLQATCTTHASVGLSELRTSLSASWGLCVLCLCLSVPSHHGSWDCCSVLCSVCFPGLLNVPWLLKLLLEKDFASDLTITPFCQAQGWAQTGLSLHYLAHHRDIKVFFFLSFAWSYFLSSQHIRFLPNGTPFPPKISHPCLLQDPYRAPLKDLCNYK